MNRVMYCLLLVVGLLCASGNVFAYQNGITGRTTAGCGGSGCHSGTSSNTTLSVSGNTTLNPGAQTTLTLTITNSTKPRSGCNIDFVNSSNSVISGLASISGQGMQVQSNELIHTTPKNMSGNQSTWQFNLTAPTTPGQYTVRIAGNATLSSSQGDYNTTTQSIVVKGLTLTAPSAGSTFCGGSSATIQWTAFGVTTVNVQMSSDGGSNYNTVASPSSSNGSNSYNYTIPANTTPGSTYRFRVVDASDATLNSAMTGNFTVGTGVAITTQPSPATQNACQGSNVSYSVVASGPSPSYQWRKDGTNLNGATAPTLNLTAIATTQAGMYDCVVSSSCGLPVTSNQVTLTVEPAAAISVQPRPLTVCEGASATFNITATGNGLTYRWKKNGTDITGATTAIYTIPSVSAADAGAYTCMVTGSCGTPVTSGVGALTVVSPPSFTTNPADVIKCEGQTAAFTAAVANSNGLTYEWVKDGVTITGNARITGVNTLTLTINPLQTSDAGAYQIRAVASACQAVQLSGTALLGVNAAPPITSQPQSKVTSVGGSATFTVTATGTSLTYQWKKNGVVIVGQTQSSFTINSAAKTDEGAYTVVITGACSSTTSSAANLTVSDLPQPVLTLNASTLQFGTLKLGAQKTLTFEVSNTGTAKLDVSSIAIAGAQSSSFSSDAATFSLDPAAKKTITITFSPKALGANTAKATISSNASGTSEINFAGAAVLRAINPALAGFETTEIGKTRDTSVSLCNATTEDLVITSASIGGDVTSFSFVGTPLIAQLPLTLKKDSCLKVTLRFAPTKEGLNKLTIGFVSSQGSDTLQISGTATTSSSVELASEFGVAVHPNPVSDVLSIDIPSSLTRLTGLQITDLLGNVVSRHDVSIGRTSMDVTNIPSGLYNVIFDDGNRRLIVPVVIIH